MATAASSPTDTVQSRRVLACLFFAYLLSIMDRVIFGIVLKPMKVTFDLSDSQLGLVSGAAFALTYAVFSPIGGWIVDRSRRKLMLAGAVGFWSAATLLTGLAGSFMVLALSRVGVAVGESLLHPAAVSLIASTSPREKRAGSVSFYISAGAIGSILALFAGGVLLQRLPVAGTVAFPLVGEVEPWRVLFICAFLPGLLLAAVVMCAVKEPVRETAGQGQAGETNALTFIRRNPRVGVALFGGMTVLQMGSYAALVWNVVYLQRAFGWSAGEASKALGLSLGLAVLAGALLAGRLLTAMNRRGVRNGPILLAAGGGLFYAAFASCGYLSHDSTTALAFLSVASLAGYTPTLCAFAMMTEALPPGVRAQMAGLLTFANGIISSSLGPYLVGALNDSVFGTDAGIGFSLAVVVTLSGIVGAGLAAVGMMNYGRLAAGYAVEH